MSRSRQAGEPEIRATSTTASTRWTWRLPPSDWGKLLHVSRGALAAIDLRMPRDPRAVRAAQLARSRPEARLTLADASRASGASARTLERLFRAETGLAFGTWRQRARLLRALQLLAGNENVTSAAIVVGYESTSAFVSAFRRAMGTTPARYFRNGLA